MWDKYEARFSEPVKGSVLLDAFEKAAKEIGYRLKQEPYVENTFSYAIREEASHNGDYRSAIMASCDNFRGKGIITSSFTGIQDFCLIASPEKEYSSLRLVRYTEPEMMGFDSKWRMKKFDKKLDEFKNCMEKHLGVEIGGGFLLR